MGVLSSPPSALRLGDVCRLYTRPILSETTRLDAVNHAGPAPKRDESKTKKGHKNSALRIAALVMHPRLHPISLALVEKCGNKRRHQNKGTDAIALKPRKKKKRKVLKRKFSSPASCTANFCNVLTHTVQERDGATRIEADLEIKKNRKRTFYGSPHTGNRGSRYRARATIRPSPKSICVTRSCECTFIYARLRAYQGGCSKTPACETTSCSAQCENRRRECENE